MVGEAEYPIGSLAQSLAQLAKLNGVAALRFTISAIRKTTEMICRDAPSAVEKLQIEALLVDQTEPAGGSIAEHLRLPFVTICNALALNREPNVPPPFTPWNYHVSWWARVRNTAGYKIYDRFMRPITETVDAYRIRWGLAKLSGPEGSFSELAQISQQPPAFDFPRVKLPAHFHYVGPLRKPAANVEFPWNRLDGRPLVYASLGTLQNRKQDVFRCFTEVCAELNLQIVVAHGGGLDSGFLASLPGNPIAVPYAPQLEVLAHTRLTLTHAGLNTVLDSLSLGVPMVAVPITYEQPAIASRIRWCEAGEVIPYPKLKRDRLRKTVERVLGDSRYSANAKAVRKSILNAGGVRRAADVVEKVCRATPSSAG